MEKGCCIRRWRLGVCDVVGERSFRRSFSGGWCRWKASRGESRMVARCKCLKEEGEEEEEEFCAVVAFCCGGGDDGRGSGF